MFLRVPVYAGVTEQGALEDPHDACFQVKQERYRDMVSRSPRLWGRAGLSVPVGEPGVHYASCGTKLAQSSARVPSVVRRVWLWSGLVLFTYVVSHLANHALGLISLEVMETGRDWFLRVWRHPVGTVALYGALSAHIVLALSSLYQRRHLRLPAWEVLQLLLGLSIPPLLVTHIVGTRLSHDWLALLTRTRVWSCSIGSSAQTSA